MPDADSGSRLDDPVSIRAAQLSWDRASHGLAIVDGDGIIITSNTAFTRLVGHTGHHVEGLDMLEVFARDDVAPVLAAGDPSLWVPVAGLGADGYPFLAEINVAPVDDGDVLATVRRRFPLISQGPAEPSMNRGDVAEALSHDVRGRLRGVAGFLALAAEGIGDVTTDEALTYIDRSAAAGRVADRMLDRLVHYLRLGEASFSLSPTPLDRLVAEAELQIGCDVTVRSGPLPSVLADGSLLTDLLVELFRNAREFGRDGEPPAISVSVRSVGRWCELLVADDGRGVPPALSDEAFGLFRQLQGRNWDRGIGMGLPICRRIVDGHGGRIEIHSDGTTGTTVSVRLALAPSTER